MRFTTGDVAKKLGVSTTRVLVLMKQGRFGEVTKFGRDYVFTQENIDHYKKLPVGNPNFIGVSQSNN